MRVEGRDAVGGGQGLGAGVEGALDGGAEGGGAGEVDEAAAVEGDVACWNFWWDEKEGV